MKALRAVTGVLLACSLVFTAACAKSNNADSSASPSQSPSQSPAASPTSSEAASKPDPFGKYEQPVTMTIVKEVIPDDKSLPEGDTVDNNQFTRLMEEKLNLQFEALWVAAGGDAYNQKMSLAISSNDLPDAMVVNEKDFRLMIKSGQLEDLTEVYEQYASPNLRSMYDATGGRALAGATFDGKLMALPNVSVKNDSVPLLWIRQDWLDKLQLQPPKTRDELAAVAKAFIDAKLGGSETYGLVGEGSAGLFFAGIFSSHQSYPMMWVKNNEGKVVYGSVAPETKNALATLRSFYEQGILDKEFAIRKNVTELIVGGKAGITLAPWWSPFWPLNDATKQDPTANWQAYPAPVDDNGTFNARMNPTTSSYFVVKKGYSNPEAIVKYMNIYASVESDAELLSMLDPSVNAGYWPLRATMVDPNVLANRYEAVKKVMDGAMKPEELDAGTGELYNAILKEQENPLEDMGAWANANAYLRGAAALQSPMNEVYSLFTSQTKTMELKWPALKKLEEETFNKIIMGAVSLDAFDQFVEDWNRQGGAEITKEVEEAIAQ